jgi:hypothetical protein
VERGEVSDGQVGAKKNTAPARGRLTAGYLLGFAVSIICSFGAAQVFGWLPPFPYLFFLSFESETWWVWLLPACLVGAVASLILTHPPLQWKRVGLARVAGKLLARILVFAVLILALQFLVAALMAWAAPQVFN